MSHVFMFVDFEMYTIVQRAAFDEGDTKLLTELTAGVAQFCFDGECQHGYMPS